jgi:hypothetical protein
MYKKGDIGIPKNPEEFEKYSKRTHELTKLFGGQISGTRTG